MVLDFLSLLFLLNILIHYLQSLAFFRLSSSKILVWLLILIFFYRCLGKLFRIERIASISKRVFCCQNFSEEACQKYYYTLFSLMALINATILFLLSLYWSGRLMCKEETQAIFLDMWRQPAEFLLYWVSRKIHWLRLTDKFCRYFDKPIVLYFRVLCTIIFGSNIDLPIGQAHLKADSGQG